MDWNRVSGQIIVQASSLRLCLRIATESTCLERFGRRFLKDLYRISLEISKATELERLFLMYLKLKT